ncbi:hypothetical protein ACWEOW_01100 [Monashia sp. NPDC004114]
MSTMLAALCLCVLGPAWSVPLTAITLLVFNSVAQAVRRSVKAVQNVPTRMKNTGKALGMILGGAVGATHLGPVALAVFAVYFVWQAVPTIPPGPRIERGRLGLRDRTLLWGEFVHHAHYFAYCYSFWYLAPALISPWTGLWFVVGWVAYFALERIWREGRRAFAPKVIAVGHVTVAAALLMMPHMNASGVLAAWFVTGIGGGTAYMLGSAAGQGPRERFEDCGHVAGAAISVFVAVSAADNRSAAQLTVIAAAILSVTTAIIFSSVSRLAPDRTTQRIGETNARR